MNEHVFEMLDTLTDWVSVVNGVIRDLSPYEQDQRLGIMGRLHVDMAATLAEMFTAVEEVEK